MTSPPFFSEGNEISECALGATFQELVAPSAHSGLTYGKVKSKAFLNLMNKIQGRPYLTLVLLAHRYLQHVCLRDVLWGHPGKARSRDDRRVAIHSPLTSVHRLRSRHPYIFQARSQNGQQRIYLLVSLPCQFTHPLACPAVQLCRLRSLAWSHREYPGYRDIL